MLLGWLTATNADLLLLVSYLAWRSLHFSNHTERPTKTPISTKSSENSTESRLASLEGQFKNLELEWENVYDKLRKIAGRMDKTRALTANTDNSQPELPVESAIPLSRAEVLKSWRSRGRGY